MARTSMNAAAGGPGYNHAVDTIVGWDLDVETSSVTFLTRRPDNSTGKVAEDAAQRADEAKVVQYWESFDKPREETIQCANYRIFEILAHRPGKPPKLLIHWVGYAADPASGSASWEPLANMIQTLDRELVYDYLNRLSLTPQLTKKKQQQQPDAAGAADAALAGPSSSKSKRAQTPASNKRGRPSSSSTAAAAPAKRARRSVASPTAAAAANKTKAEGADEDQQQQAVVSAPPPKKRGRKPASASASASSSSSAASASAAAAAPAPASVSSAAPTTLFKFDFSASGLPRDAVVQLYNLATSLCTQPNPVVYRSQITPLEKPDGGARDGARSRGA